MKNTSPIIGAIASLFVAASILFASAEPGFTPIFNGKNLKGWSQKNGTATYRIEDGVVIGKTQEGSPNSFMCTEKEYGDFELRFEVKVDDGLNSGVQIRSASKEDFKKGRVHGPQVEIEKSPGESGYIYWEGTGNGWMTPKEDLVRHEAIKNGEWNEFRVVAKGANIKTWINGKMISDLTHEEAYKAHPKGFIGLQVHGIKKGSGPFEVRWRNIRIRELE